MKHIVSYSGGKDSTAMLLMMIEKNMPIDDIVFADTGLEFPEMYPYLEKVEKYIGREITRIKPLLTYEDYFYRRYKRGGKIGKTYGFPCMNGVWCNSHLKVYPLRKYEKTLGTHISYIGYAADEPKRYKRLKEYQKALLYEWGITENQCLKYLEEKNLLNPLYKKFRRLGCWCCHNQSKSDLRILRKDYPDLWEKLLQYDKDSPVKFKINKTVHDFKEEFDMEDKQATIFD